MIHKSLEQIMLDAENSWDNDLRNKGGINDKHKDSFLLGWVQSSYTDIYRELPSFKKDEFQKSLLPGEYIRQHNLWKKLKK